MWMARQAELAQALGVAAVTAPVTVALARLLGTLRDRDRWLLVFDKAEDPAALAPYLPRGGGLWELGRYEQARRLGEDALVRMRRVLGAEHPDTLRAAHSLAAALANRGSARSDPLDGSVNQVSVSGMDHVNSDRNPSRGAGEAADAT